MFCSWRGEEEQEGEEARELRGIRWLSEELRAEWRVWVRNLGKIVPDEVKPLDGRKSLKLGKILRGKIFRRRLEGVS
jgi:hypothetical protein